MSTEDRDGFAREAAQASAVSGARVELTGFAGLSRVRAARFRLANGLTIVLAPDDRAPVFAYQTWFKVGSKDEEPEHTGLAHLFEHLMFKGTKHHPTGELDREMEKRGTQTNAATWVDWTFYHEALAARSDNLETVVDYEVDRMRNLILDAETFASELEVVKNERRMAIEDSVAGRLNEMLYELAFRAHSYRWPTIGSMAHLEAASLEDLERFYRTFYAPNNAVIVVAGAMDVVATLTLLARSYGPLATQPVARRTPPAEPRQTEPRAGRVARPIVAPQVAIGFHGPAQGHADFPALQMLGEVLVEGDNARLYRRLVTEEKLATEVEGALMPFADPGMYEVMLTLRAGADPERAIAVVQEELDALARGISDAESEKARNGLELSFYESWRTPWGTAENLGHFETNYGEFALALRGHERLLAVRDVDLARVAREVFRATNRTSVVAYPEATGGPARGEATHD